MKFLSQITTMTSGSVNGLTASHNRSGRYFRARVTPVNPSTPLQQLIRNVFSELSIRWSTILTQAERDGWDLYADNVSVTDKLGQAIFLTGQNMYLRSNVPRGQFDGIGGVTLPTVDTPPSIFTLAEVDPTASEIITAPQSGSITFDVTLPWVSEDNAGFLPYTGRPQNASIGFFGGPYRFQLPIEGEVAMPPTSPQAKNTGYSYVIGQRVFSYARITRADGRLSPIFKMADVLAV